EQAGEVGAMCPAAHSKKPTPDGSGDGLASARCAAPPSLPRGIDRRRERRGLLASGGRLTFPGKATQWRRAVKNARYSGGGAPESHRPPWFPVRFQTRAPVLAGDLLGARTASCWF